MTVDTLKDSNKKDLAKMAKDRGIVGWHAMRKDQLIRALVVPMPIQKENPKPPAVEKPANSSHRRSVVPAPVKPVPPKVERGDQRERRVDVRVLAPSRAPEIR